MCVMWVRLVILTFEIVNEDAGLGVQFPRVVFSLLALTWLSRQG